MARLLYDLTGLLHWYAYFRRPAGVQRVIEQVGASTVLQEAARPSAGRFHSVEFVLRGLGSDRFYRLDPVLLPMLRRSRPEAIALLRCQFARALRQATAREVLAAARYFHLPYLALGLTGMERLFLRKGRPKDGARTLQVVEPPTAADAYFNPGDLWWQNDYASALVGLKESTGVRIVQMIHDLYVLQRPEWSPRGFSAVFAEQVRGIAPHVDRWLTSSAYVKDRLRECLQGWSIPGQPMSVLPMGWDSFPSPNEPAGGDDQEVLDRSGVGQRPFILFVGTVEPRKNLPSLLDAMANLRRRLDRALPVLVIAGGYGWRARSVHRRLWQGIRDGHLVWVRNPADRDLQALYRRARFTVMPSHGEGWGLAVQESIALGVPCIASSGGATPEAGRDMAIYVDPARPEQLEAAMSSWIVDDSALAAARARIRESLGKQAFATWNDAATMLLGEAFGTPSRSRIS